MMRATKLTKTSEFVPMVPAFVIPFIDENFKKWCVTYLDRDGNGIITLAEAQHPTRLNCSGAGISSLSGIEYFSNLETFDVSSNSLSRLDVTKNTALKNLNVSFNTSLTWHKYSNCAIDPRGLPIGAYVTVDGLSGVFFFGSGSTVKIVSADETNTTWENAKTWCSGKGSAWYLPDLDELGEVYNNRVALNTTLAARGATQFNLMESYWSSEEYTTILATGWSFSAGKAVEGFSKTYSLPTRAVRAL